MHTETDKIYSTYILVKVKMLIKPFNYQIIVTGSMISQWEVLAAKKVPTPLSTCQLASSGSQKVPTPLSTCQLTRSGSQKVPYSTVYMSAGTFWQPKKVPTPLSTC